LTGGWASENPDLGNKRTFPKIFGFKNEYEINRD
jgi:hypothetical protein